MRVYTLRRYSVGVEILRLKPLEYSHVKTKTGLMEKRSYDFRFDSFIESRVL
jgi:hypothetical protein